MSATKVPKEPDTTLDKSYPVTFFTTVPPDFMMSPLPFTPLNPNTKSRTLPTLNLREPAKFVATHPAADPLLDSPSFI